MTPPLDTDSSTDRAGDDRYRAVTTIGLDCDDTLWHSENRFQDIHARYRALLRPHVAVSDAELDEKMLATERTNLRYFGYGAKGFTISMIETAIEVTAGAVPSPAILTMIEWGKELLDHPVELLDGVAETVDALVDRGYRLLLITKGDLWHQESKVAASGLAELADGVEIVPEKDIATYRRVLDLHGVDPPTFCMVGNSARSDVLPVLELGGHAIQIPYRYLWEHEALDEEHGAEFEVLDSITELLDRFDGAS